MKVQAMGDLISFVWAISIDPQYYWHGGGYLSGEDERGGRGGVAAAEDRDGGGVLTEAVVALEAVVDAL